MNYTINGKEILMSVIGREFMESETDDHDWEVKLYFSDFLAVAYVTSHEPEDALDYLPKGINNLLQVETPEEISLELKGVWK